jgi:hypothetical protein
MLERIVKEYNVPCLEYELKLYYEFGKNFFVRRSFDYLEVYLNGNRYEWIFDSNIERLLIACARGVR